MKRVLKLAKSRLKEQIAQKEYKKELRNLDDFYSQSIKIRQNLAHLERASGDLVAMQESLQANEQTTILEVIDDIIALIWHKMDTQIHQNTYRFSAIKSQLLYENDECLF